MYRGIKLIAVILFALFICGELMGQNKNFNEHYNPVQLSKRLSYENFRDLKLLQTAIMNFGGGKDEVDRLIDQYAEASALYFQYRYDESAALFQENQKEILLSAKRITTKYKELTEKLLLDSTKKSIKDQITGSLVTVVKKGDENDVNPEVYLGRARYAVNTANDFWDRFKDATITSPMNFIKAIYYYRKAKENIISLYMTLEKDKDKKKQIDDVYKKDIMDNDNKVFKAKEKNP